MGPAALAAACALVLSAVRYDSHVRTELQVRSPLLGENTRSLVVADTLLLPEGTLKFLHRRAELTVAYEPAVVVRDVLTQPQAEIRHSAYTTGFWQAHRYLRLGVLETATFGTFPFQQAAGPRGTSPGLFLLAPTGYLFSYGSLSAESSFGLRRFNLGAEAAWILNGPLSASSERPVPGQLNFLSQRGPLITLGAWFTDFVPRAQGVLNLTWREVVFSSNTRVEYLSLSGSLSYELTRWLKATLELGPAWGGDTYTEPSLRYRFMPLASLTVQPSLLFRPSRVLPSLRTRLVPYVDPLSTRFYPRWESTLGVDWKAGRGSPWQFLADVTGGVAVMDSVQQGNGEVRVSGKVRWLLTHWLALESEAQFSWTKHLMVSPRTFYTWYGSVALVAQQERGKL